MKIILTRDVPKVGSDGEVLTVADGFARNYLFPRQLAVVAKGGALKQHENRLAREAAKGKALLTTAQQNSELIKDKQYQLIAKSSPKTNRLFGSITEADVAEAILKVSKVEVDKRKISLIDPIKLTGIYSLSAKLHPDVTVPFSIEVVTIEQLEAREKARLLAEEKAIQEAERLAAAEAAREIAAAERAAAAAQRAIDEQNAPPVERKPYDREAARLAKDLAAAMREAPDAEG